MASLLRASTSCLATPSCSRLFSGSVAVLASNAQLKQNKAARWNKKTPGRVKSKRAIAAREKRKEILAMKEFAKLDKLKFEEAVNVLRAVEVASPSATLELLIKTKLGTGITLPKGRFKLPRKPDTNKAKHEVICVFADGKQAAEAKAAGADIVGGMELVDDILSGKIKATSYLATKQFALDLAPKLGRFLGPLGLMPSERRGTAVDDLGTHIKRMGGTSEWKADKHGIVRLAFAKVNFTPEDVARNFRYFMTNVKDATGNNKSAGHMSKKMAAKPVTKILQVRLSSTRGPSILLSDP